MVNPSSSMTLELPPSDRYLAKTEKSGSFSTGISLPQVGHSRALAVGRPFPAGWPSRTVRS